MAPPTVTVITPAFNAQGFIRQTMESVLRQVWTDLEHIVVDDCSTDGTASVVAELARRDRRIRVLQTPMNSGQWAARNMALDHAKGRFLAFLDSDDLWDADKLAQQVPFASKSEGAITFTGYRVITEAGEVMGRVNGRPERITYAGMLAGHRIGCLTAMLDRSRVGRLRFGPPAGAEDLGLWLELLRTQTVASGLDVELASYRIRHASASRNKWRYVSKVWEVYRAQPISVPRKLYYFACYGVRGVRKHLTSGAHSALRG